MRLVGLTHGDAVAATVPAEGGGQGGRASAAPPSAAPYATEVLFPEA
jgi:hypothetical protein